MNALAIYQKTYFKFDTQIQKSHKQNHLSEMEKSELKSQQKV